MIILIAVSVGLGVPFTLANEHMRELDRRRQWEKWSHPTRYQWRHYAKDEMRRQREVELSGKDQAGCLLSRR